MSPRPRLATSASFARLGESTGTTHQHRDLQPWVRLQEIAQQPCHDGREGLSHLGDHLKALTDCRQALDLYRQLGDQRGEAVTSDSLGYAHHHLGNHAEALTCYQAAIDLFRDIGDRYNQASTLTRLGDTYDAARDYVAARSAWQHALAILSEMNHPDAEHARAKLRLPGPVSR